MRNPRRVGPATAALKAHFLRMPTRSWASSSSRSRFVPLLDWDSATEFRKVLIDDRSDALVGRAEWIPRLRVCANRPRPKYAATCSTTRHARLLRQTRHDVPPRGNRVLHAWIDHDS